MSTNAGNVIPERPIVRVGNVRFEVGDVIDAGGFATVYTTPTDVPGFAGQDAVLRIEHTRMCDTDTWASQSQRLKMAVQSHRFLEILGAHPGVTRLFMWDVEYDRANGKETVVSVLSRCEGSLTAWMGANPNRTVAQSVAVISKAAAAVQYVHDSDIIHRDIKPANILFGADGQIVVADFGLAIPKDPSLRTSTDDVPRGTPFLMAPEQQKGRPSVYSDQYALGVTAYLLLTGTLPFYTQDSAGYMHAHIEGDSSSLSGGVTHSVPSAVREVISRALAQDENRRHLSVKVFAEELEDAAYNALPEGSPDRALLQGAQKRAQARTDIIAGYALAGQGHLSDALAYYDHATRYDPVNMKAWFQKAHVLQALGRKAEADNAMAKALACHMRELPDYGRKGYMLAHFGLHDLAVTSYAEARARGHFDALAVRHEIESLDCLAAMEGDFGQHAEATAHVELADSLRAQLARKEIAAADTKVMMPAVQNPQFVDISRMLARLVV